MAMVSRFDVYLVNLDRQPSRDAKNTRPCVIVSPDEMNAYVGHVTVAPISASGTDHPTRIPVELLNSPRSIVLDQLMTVDRERLVKRIAHLDAPEQKAVLDRLQEFFAP